MVNHTGNNNTKQTVATGSILVVFAVYALFSQYVWVTLLAGAGLAIILTQLWKPYIPPVLLYLLMYHWVQVFGAVLYSDYLGIQFDEMYGAENVELLFYATLIQIAIMAIILARVFKVEFTPTLDYLKAEAAKLDTKKILTAYAVTTLIFPTLIAVTYNNASLNQLIQSFAVVRKMLLMMLIFLLFLKKTEFKNAIILILILEFLLSFVSYFSSFKDIIFYIIATYFTVYPSLKNKLVWRVGPLMVLLIMFMIFWSSVKDGYRTFLNQGSRKQEVAVSRGDALNYLLDKAGTFDADSFHTGAEVLLHRVQYMEQYGAVYGRVPSVIEHTNGSNLTTTATFLLTPRFIFDKKKILDPSSKTSYYTGKNFANAEMGTSISMGYFCDLYIDFGLWIMMIPLAIITFLIGRASNYIINNKNYNLLFTYSLFMGTILSLGTFESDIIFYLGTVRNYIVVMIVGNTLLFPWLNKNLLR